MLATEVRQEELEKEYWLEKLRDVCVYKNIGLIMRMTAYKYPIVYIELLNSIVISANATGNSIELFIQKRMS